jgi:glycolate oxidase FAD binding subunit
LSEDKPVIDGIRVAREETPATITELAEMTQRAWASGTSLIPIGGGTKINLGNAPRSAQIAMHTGGLRGIVEYEPDNLTISALAGTSLQEIQDCARAHGQFLALDPPHPHRATLGGIVACNTSGPLRCRYGTIRDLLLGVKIVLADGSLTRAGGKLVKNVSGYDMCRLYTGSLGTLGILSELTFKLEPRSENLGTILLGFPAADQAFASAQRILRAQTSPDAMEIWNGRAYRMIAGEEAANPWILGVRYGGVEAAVNWQINRAKETAAGTSSELLGLLSHPESESFWERSAVAREEAPGQDPVILKCSVLCADTAATAGEMQILAESLGAQVAIFCHAGNFIIYGRFDWNGEDLPVSRARIGLSDLRKYCCTRGGHAVLEQARHDIKAGFDVWGYDAPAVALMQRIKHEFDPRGILNPGRFVGGI